MYSERVIGLLVAVAILLTMCPGCVVRQEPQGEPGPQVNEGPRSKQGPPGKPSIPGINGVNFYTSTGAPGSSLGVTGDFYLNIANGWVCKKTSAYTWEQQITFASDKPTYSAEPTTMLEWYTEGERKNYLRNYTFAVGDSLRSICFDGIYVWLTNYSDNTVSKIDATTGTVDDTITVGDSPRGICFDGTYVWVTNYSDNTVSKIDATTDTVDDTITVGDSPRGICFDGTYIWVANVGDGTLSKIVAATGTIANTITVRNNPDGICFDGAYVWVAHFSNDTVSKLDAATGTVYDTFIVSDAPFGIFRWYLCLGN